MIKNRFQFSQKVPTTGFCIHSKGRVKYVTSRIPINQAYEAKIIHPLDRYAGLFRTFADTEINEKGILRFANKYGLLGLPGELITLDNKTRACMGEPLNEWYKAIANMRVATELWGMIEKGEKGKLKKHVHWKVKGWIDYTHVIQSPAFTLEIDETIASKKANKYAEHFNEFVYGDIINPAKLYLQSFINKQIDSRVSPRMLQDRCTLGLFHVPNSLIGALWLQFAISITTGAKYQQCPWCSSWFEPERNTKKFCSDSCRVSASRKKRRKGK